MDRLVWLRIGVFATTVLFAAFRKWWFGTTDYLFGGLAMGTIVG
jgi:hypothetical protein